MTKIDRRFSLSNEVFFIEICDTVPMEQIAKKIIRKYNSVSQASNNDLNAAVGDDGEEDAGDGHRKRDP